MLFSQIEIKDVHCIIYLILLNLIQFRNRYNTKGRKGHLH